MKKTIIDSGITVYSGEVGYVLVDNNTIGVRKIQVGVIMEVQDKRTCSPPFCQFELHAPIDDEQVYNLCRYICDNLKKYKSFDLGFDVDQYDYYIDDKTPIRLGSTFNVDDKYVFSLIGSQLMGVIPSILTIGSISISSLYVVSGASLDEYEVRWRMTGPAYIKEVDPDAIVIREEDDSNGNESE